jgi:type VI protein secretion system component Hcp
MAVDLLMMFVSNGSPVNAESGAQVDTKDPFMKGFTPGKFFDIEDFEFGLNVMDTDSGGMAQLPAPSIGDRSGPDQSRRARSGRFSKWVEGISVKSGPGSGGGLYPVEMEPFSFTRQMDAASPLLFQNCFRTRAYDQVTLVKRRASGLHRATGNNATVSSFAFLRIDFNAVLITGIDWDGSEAEGVKERCSFVSRAVAVQYRPQRPDGSPGDIVGGEWMTLKKATSSPS